MTSINYENYRYEDLKKWFHIGKLEGAEWRLFHSIYRRSKDGRGTGVIPGDLADTSVSVRGYRVCNSPKIDGRSFRLQAACVIWVLANKRDIPRGHTIDHADRIRINNNPENLAAKIAQAQMVNRNICDGHLIGVFLNRKISIGNKRWQAVAYDPKMKKRVSLKCHHTAQEAARAYDAFVLEKHGKDAVTNASLGRI